MAKQNYFENRQIALRDQPTSMGRIKAGIGARGQIGGSAASRSMPLTNSPMGSTSDARVAPPSVSQYHRPDANSNTSWRGSGPNTRGAQQAATAGYHSPNGGQWRSSARPVQQPFETPFFENTIAQRMQTYNGDPRLTGRPNLGPGGPGQYRTFNDVPVDRNYAMQDLSPQPQRHAAQNLIEAILGKAVKTAFPLGVPAPSSGAPGNPPAGPAPGAPAQQFQTSGQKLEAADPPAGDTPQFATKQSNLLPAVAAVAIADEVFNDGGVRKEVFGGGGNEVEGPPYPDYKPLDVNQSPFDYNLNPAPQIGAARTAELNRALAAKYAEEQGRALQGLENRAGIDPDAMMGRQVDVTSTFGKASALAQAEQNLKLEVQNFAAQRDHWAAEAQRLMALAQDKSNREMANQAFNNALVALEYQEAAEMRRMEKAYEIDKRVHWTDVAGGVLGIATQGAGSLFGNAAGGGGGNFMQGAMDLGTSASGTGVSTGSSSSGLSVAPTGQASLTGGAAGAEQYARTGDFNRSAQTTIQSRWPSPYRGWQHNP